MSVLVAGERRAVNELEHLFDVHSHTCLFLTEDQFGFQEVRAYVGRCLEKGDTKGTVISHYAVNGFGRRAAHGLCQECYDPECEGCGEESESGSDTSDVPETICEVGAGPCVLSFEFRGQKLWYWQRREGKPMQTGCAMRVYERVALFAPGRGTIGLLQDFVVHAFEEINKRDECKTKAFTLYRWDSRHSFWRQCGQHPPREIETLILPKGLAKDIVSDVREFLSKDTRRWYTKRGIPYKRSFLLYGPPGSGKTSLIKMIASECGQNVYFLQPAILTDSQLANAMAQMSKNAILVLEDVDALFQAGTRESKKDVKITFSGVLNALDGFISPQNGQLIVMTSNHPQNLDPAMVRCGRIDRRFELPSPTKRQAHQMFLAFYPEAAESEEGIAAAKSFARQCIGHKRDVQIPWSMATLQNFFIMGRKLSYSEFLEELPKFIEAENVFVGLKSKNGKKEKKENGMENGTVDGGCTEEDEEAMDDSDWD